MRFDRKRFFDAFRDYFKRVRGTALDRQTVEAVEFLLGAFENQTKLATVEQQAYAWATVAHETAWTFRPIREYRARAGTKGRTNQDRYWLTGYYGRGYVQLTWQRNYADMSKRLGIDLVNRPDLALDAKTAFAILAEGMAKGTFTGKKIGDYVKGGKKDYVNARRVINGTDKAAHIASIATAFESILRAALRPAVEPTEQAVRPTNTTQILPETSVNTAGPLSDGSFKAYIPQIDTAKRWMASLLGLTGLGGVGGFIGGLPPWALVVLGVCLGILLTGTVVMFIMYHGRVFDYVKEMNRLRAQPDTLDPELSSEL